MNNPLLSPKLMSEYVTLTGAIIIGILIGIIIGFILGRIWERRREPRLREKVRHFERELNRAADKMRFYKSIVKGVQTFVNQPEVISDD